MLYIFDNLMTDICIDFQILESLSWQFTEYPR